MDRVIEVKVGGNYLSKDNKNAGVKGEANVTILRISFDEGWDKYAKTVTFWDALGGNPVKVMLTTDTLEDITKSTRVYLVPIPAEPMAEAGKLTFVIDGYKGEYVKDSDGNYIIVGDPISNTETYVNKRQRSVSDTLEVKDSPIAEDAGGPTDPTPTQAEQLQGEIDKIIDTIADATKARDELVNYASEASEAANRASISEQNAETYSQNAQKAVGKTSYIGENGNWYAWDSTKEEFYDTGVKAQAGSTVYCGENPPENADVWLNPNGEASNTEKAIQALREMVDLLYAKSLTKTVSIDLLASNWVKDSNNQYSQVVAIDGITEYSKIDLQPNTEQLVIFYEKDLTFVAENEDGVVTVFCIGQAPLNDYSIQATITEVEING